MLVAFTLTTLHTAPLAENFFFGAFQGGEPMFLGTAPDLQFLHFAQNQSVGALCCTVDEVFSPKNDFVSNYAERRRGLERHDDEVRHSAIDGKPAGGDPRPPGRRAAEKETRTSREHRK